MPRPGERLRRLHWFTVPLLLLVCAAALRQPPVDPRVVTAVASPAAAPFEVESGESLACTVERVVDGDTLVVEIPTAWGPLEERVRLQCVDTEESHSGSGTSDSKPYTEFGITTAAWARDWFAPPEGSREPLPARLLFEPGQATRDVYGRLLAHIECRDALYNVLLVREGYSPYFNKYGNSVRYHDRFVEAQAEAQAARRGIWDPATNRGGAARPYAELLPWWQTRAEAIDRFRAYEREHPGRVLALERDLDEIRRACEAGEEIVVFAPVCGIRSVGKGNLWVELGAPDERPFILFVPSAARDELDAIPIDRYKGEGKQNYVYLAGAGRMYRDIAEIELTTRDQVSEDPPAE